MRIVATVWYLCGVFLLASFGQSAMTVVPGLEGMRSAVVIVLLALAGSAGVIAGWLTAKRRKQPDHRIFQSNAVAVVGMCAAAVLTVVVFAATFG